MRVTFDLKTIFALDTALKEKYLDLQTTFVDDQQLAYNVGQISALAAAASQAIPFGDVDIAKFVVLRTQGDIDLVFNAGAEVIKLKPADFGAEGASEDAVLILVTEVTSIQVTNVGSSAADVLYAIAGTP